MEMTREKKLRKAFDFLRTWRDHQIQLLEDMRKNTDLEIPSAAVCLLNPWRVGEEGSHVHIEITTEFLDICCEAVEDLILKEDQPLVKP